MKTISVVMPVYNVEQFVVEAVHSVLSQSYPNFELLVIDDQSPDDSIPLVKAINDPRIKVISHQQNKGLAAARNTGIRHARGELIAFIDSDDLWHKDKLKYHLEHFNQDPELSISFSRSEFIDSNGNSTQCYQMPKLKNISSSHLFCRNPIGNGSAAVVKKSTFDAIGFNPETGKLASDNSNEHSSLNYFDEEFRQSEDIECWLRISLLTNAKIEGLNKPLTYYRINSGGLSSNLYSQYNSWNRLAEKVSRYFPNFSKRYQSQARAYQLRYLARQAVRLNDGKTALLFFVRAMRENWRILFQEPGRTCLTFAAGFLVFAAPKWFSRHQPKLMKYWGKHQLAIIQENS